METTRLTRRLKGERKENRFSRGRLLRLFRSALLHSAFCILPFSAFAQDSLRNTASSTPTGVDDIATRAREGPIDISSNSPTGGTTYNVTPAGRVATSTGGVTIQTDDASIYCDHAEYNLDTQEALLVGNVRIYRLDASILADRAIYNFQTKGLRALDFNGARLPFVFGGESVFSPTAGAQFNIRQGDFTTDDSSKPDYHLHARRIRIYPDNRVVFVGSTLYVGTTPVFYFPYFYQSLDQQSGYQVTPGYSSIYGAYLLTGVSFPVTDKLTGTARVDYRTSRGAGFGLNLEYKPNRRVATPGSTAGAGAYASDDDPSVPAPIGAPNSSPHNGAAGSGPASSVNPFANGEEFALQGDALSKQIRRAEDLQFLSYFTHDDHTDLNRTSLPRLPIDPNRYRFALKGTDFITDDLYIKTDIDKLSDRYLLQDFYEGEFTRDPNPDNVLSVTYHQPTWVASVVGRAQFNDFFDTTERLPDATLDIPHLPLWDSGFFYTSTNSAAFLRRSYASDSPLPEYSTFRLDTYHEFTYAKTLFGWLSVVPRVGLRATYYSHSAPGNDASDDLQSIENDTSDITLLQASPSTLSTSDLARQKVLQQSIGNFQVRGDLVRPVVDAGVEVSFKLSRVYGGVDERVLGLDQLQHIIQPYVNFSEVEDFGVGSRQLLQFDRQIPTTQLLPINFPQYNSIDSIDEATVVRMGVRNRIQTKRDALTFNWLEVDTFFQVNAYDPAYQTKVSNVFNQVTFRPVPWVNMTFDSQLPLFNGKRGFTEVDSAVQFMPTSKLDVTVSHRYLDNNPYFANSSLLRLNMYYRLDENWGAGFSERYEFAAHQLQAQSYTIYRDLTSFVASLGLTVRDNNGISDYGFLFSLTLKGVPRLSLPVGFDVNSVANDLTQ